MVDRLRDSRLFYLTYEFVISFSNDLRESNLRERERERRTNGSVNVFRELFILSFFVPETLLRFW